MAKEVKTKTETKLEKEDSKTITAEQASGFVAEQEDGQAISLEEEDEIAPSTVQGSVLMPMKDMAGYMLFVA